MQIITYFSGQWLMQFRKLAIQKGFVFLSLSAGKVLWGYLLVHIFRQFIHNISLFRVTMGMNRVITHRKLPPMQSYQSFSNSRVVYHFKNYYVPYCSHIVSTNCLVQGLKVRLGPGVERCDKITAGLCKQNLCLALPCQCSDSWCVSSSQETFEAVLSFSFILKGMARHTYIRDIDWFQLLMQIMKNYYYNSLYPFGFSQFMFFSGALLEKCELNMSYSQKQGLIQSSFDDRTFSLPPLDIPKCQNIKVR